MMKEIYEEITMKKLFTSLPFRLMAGVVIGILAGWLAGMESAGRAGTAVMNVVVSVRFILAELINFCVPLIIIGFIAPSITRLGHSASRMLGIALLCAYASTILAAFFPWRQGTGSSRSCPFHRRQKGQENFRRSYFSLKFRRSCLL